MKVFLKKRMFLTVEMMIICSILIFCDTKTVFAGSSYVPRTTAPASNNSYYYGSKNIFYTSGYGMPNCTAYAYGRAYELLGSKPSLCTGNAGQWYSYNAKHNFYKYGSTPKLGAIACWDNYDSNQGHVAVVEKVNSDGTILISESHWRGTVFDTRTIKSNSSNYLTSKRFLGYIYIGNWGDGGGYNPEGACNITGIAGGIKISGWALDKDKKAEALSVHVYIGGAADKGEGHAIIANSYRPDVPTNLKDPALGNYHGIDSVVYTQKTGMQEIYVYAINVRAGTDHTLIGHVTINIPKDTEKPKIKDVKVSNISKDSYTVSFTATDNVGIEKVWLPSWSVANAQDDIKDEPYTKSGNTYSFKVKRSSHKNECGPYRSDIYVYDKAGNYNWATANEAGVSLLHYEVTDPAVSATCTTAGKTAGKHCSVCKKVITAQKTVPAKGHTEVVDPAVAPTCTTAGKTAGKHCSVCKKVITAQQTIPAKGHTEVVDPAVAPTCTTAGKTAGKHCSVCKQVITAQKTVPAKGHTEVVDPAVAPTCTTAGKTAGKHCSVCKKVITAQSAVAAKGHTYGKGVVTKEATESATGILTYTCGACGNKKTETIPMKIPQPQEQPQTEKPSVPNKPVTPQKPEQPQKPQKPNQPEKPMTDTGSGNKVFPIGTVMQDSSRTGTYRVIASGSAAQRAVAYVGKVGNGSVVKIPDAVVLAGTKYNVTAIASYAFSGNKNLKKVVIGSGIVTIGDNAFSNCVNLKSVLVGKNVKEIGNKAFYKCDKLKKVKIPAQVEKIGKQAFYECRKLSQITIQTKKLNAKKIGKKAFGKTSEKITVAVPANKMKAYKKALYARGISKKAKMKKLK